MLECSDRLVTLRGGLTVSVGALRLAWALEDRGFRFEVVDDSDLCVRPGSALTADDVALIRAHKPALLALVAYCEQVEARV